MNFSTDNETFLGNVNTSSDAKKFDNSTFDDDLSKKNLKFIFDIQAFLSVLVVMLAMGAEIPWDDLWYHIKRPISMGIGLVSQFILMPVSAFVLLLVSGVEGVHATGVLIIACCPGGPLSNMFSYLSGGDLPLSFDSSILSFRGFVRIPSTFALLLVSGVAVVLATGVLILACCPDGLSSMFTYLSGRGLPLSVAMTTASTAMATGMLPGNLWLYGRYFETADLVIPYKKMAISILIATSPVCLGMIIRWKAPRIAKWIAKIGVWTGLLLILGNTALIIVIFPDMFTSISPRVYVVILLLPFLGLALGYGSATLFRQKVPVCKTVSIECGIQNIPLALTVISLSFSVEVQKDIIVLPHVYLFGIVVGCTTLVGGYQLHKRTRAIRLPNNKEGNAEDLEKEDLMKTKDQGIELRSKLFSSNGNYPSRQRNMPI